MKKFLSLLFVLVMIFSFSISHAEIDISNLSFEELVALKDKINLAIWNSKEWKEVKVPQGEWIVGEDIPAGKWTIKCADINRNDFMLGQCNITWGYKENGYISTYPDGDIVVLYNPNSQYYETGELTEIAVELKDGMVFSVHTFYAPVIFTPYTGKPDLGF